MLHFRGKRIRRMKRYAAALFGVAGKMIVLATTSAHAAGNAPIGAALFNRCAICHSTTKGAPNRMGPNLFGVVGRKAGTYPGFSYSAAMRHAGFVWTPLKLDAYLTAPQTVVPGNNMPFAGIPDPGQRADLSAYLATLK
jgi:cytochrome c